MKIQQVALLPDGPQNNALIVVLAEDGRMYGMAIADAFRGQGKWLKMPEIATETQSQLRGEPIVAKEIPIHG